MRLLIVGAGGHAKVVLDAALAAGLEIAGVIGQQGRATELLGYQVSDAHHGIEADGFIAATGDNAARAEEHRRYVSYGLRPLSVIHPSAVLADGVVIGEGTFVAAGVVVNVGATVGDDVVLNTGCRIDHDCVVGNHALIGPGANLCGSVHAGEGCLVGVGASVVPGARIGEWSVVGAGAAVIGDLPPRMVCVGVPARPLHSIEAPK